MTKNGMMKLGGGLGAFGALATFAGVVLTQGFSTEALMAAIAALGTFGGILVAAFKAGRPE